MIDIRYDIKPSSPDFVFYYSSNIGVFNIKKQNPITSINFYRDDKLINSVSYGKRNSASPKSLQDLKNSYIGIYKGQAPSYDSDELMSVILEILPNSTYILKQTRLNNKDRIFESKGKWLPTDDLSSIVLDYDKNKDEQIFIYFIDKNTAEWFDWTGERKENKSFRLKK
jgi:hypothetical protein